MMNDAESAGPQVQEDGNICDKHEIDRNIALLQGDE